MSTPINFICSLKQIAFPNAINLFPNTNSLHLSLATVCICIEQTPFVAIGFRCYSCIYSCPGEALQDMIVFILNTNILLVNIDFLSICPDPT